VYLGSWATPTKIGSPFTRSSSLLLYTSSFQPFHVLVASAPNENTSLTGLHQTIPRVISNNGGLAAMGITRSNFRSDSRTSAD